MTIALAVLAVLLTFASIGSGVAKLLKVESVMTSMESVGVKPQQVPLLAVLEIAGGLGLVVGIWVPALGTLAAVCLALYFLGAVASHLRAKHGAAEFAPALVIFLIAVAVSALELGR